MSTAALRLVPPAPARVEGKPCLEYFGSATITAIVGEEVELETSMHGGGARQWARLAIASGYRPQVRDVVLAIATADNCYVIGVLEGRGPTVLDAPGDLELRALHGAIRIFAAEECVVAGPTVRVAADTLELAGGTLREEFETVRRRITGMLDVRAKAICTTVAETYRLAARRIASRGDDSVSIDSPSINLG